MSRRAWSSMAQTEHRLISNVATERQTSGRTGSSVGELGDAKTVASITLPVSGVVADFAVKVGISRVEGVRQ